MSGIDGTGRSKRRKTLVVLGSAIAAAFSLLVSAPVVGDGLNSSPAPASEVIVHTVPATSLQVAGARGLELSPGLNEASAAAKGNRKKKVRRVLRKLTVSSRLTDQEILTEEGTGTYVGIKCPKGSIAISGGVLSRYINLLVSNSSPNHPLTRKYSPRTWWLTVVNVNVDGNGGTLPWQGMVNCVSPAKLRAG